MLESELTRLRHLGYDLAVSESAIEQTLRRGHHKLLGARRPMRNTVEHLVQNALARDLLSGGRGGGKLEARSARLSGSRPLTPREERLLVRHIRRINARDRALVSAQMFLGFRISEVLALTIGHVLYEGKIRTRVALPPRFLKGRRGTTRTVPIGPELHRALEYYLEKRARHSEPLPNAPLFLSPRHGIDGEPQSIGRSTAEKIIKRALRTISPDPQGLSTHRLRKSWAVRLYKASGHDLLIVRDGLGHHSVEVTQAYLPTARSRVDALILKTDWTHRKPRGPKNAP